MVFDSLSTDISFHRVAEQKMRILAEILGLRSNFESGGQVRFGAFGESLKYSMLDAKI